jgi:small subunit ribosomal protein S15
LARLHTRKHGKSKSRKPASADAKLDADRPKVEKAILEYSKQGLDGAAIGRMVKEKHGAGYLKPLLGKRLDRFLAENGAEKRIPDDLMALMRKAVKMHNHLSANHRDVYGKLRLTRVEAKIGRLSKYYRNEGRLPADWKYDPAQAALIIKKD